MHKWMVYVPIAVVVVGMLVLTLNSRLTLINIMALMITTLWLDVVWGKRPK